MLLVADFSDMAQYSFCTIACCTEPPSSGPQRVRQSELAGSNACLQGLFQGQATAATSQVRE